MWLPLVQGACAFPPTEALAAPREAEPPFAIRGTGSLNGVSRPSNYPNGFSNYPKVGPHWNCGVASVLLEDALMLADDLEDGTTGYLIERALDEARSRQFTPRG